MKKVTLQICDEFYEFAREQAQEDEYFRTQDYLTGVLNMALLCVIERDPEMNLLPPPLPLVILTPEEDRVVRKAENNEKQKLPDRPEVLEIDVNEDIPF